MDEFARQYGTALRNYVGGEGEAALARAYELGREALANGLGVLEVVACYHEALAALFKDVQGGGREIQARRARDFFMETLAPFEMTHRGFRETNDRLRKVNESLRQSNADLETFAYTVAHDLRAPLRHMQGFARALLEDFAERLDPLAKEYAARITAAAQRMDDMIRDLLTYSRLREGERLRLRPVPLESVLKSVLAQVEGELREREAKVIVPRPLLNVMGHQIALEQVLLNLVTNAIKFVPTGVKPEVSIWTDDRGKRVRVWVRDNGIGISPRDQERIFDLFRRLPTSEPYPGTGVGLAIVRRGVAQMQGQVGVESIPGRGSSFWVELLKATEGYE